MTYLIEIESSEYDVPTERLREAASTVLSQHNEPLGTEIAIRVMSNDEIQVLNETYRGVSAPTDVLSFPSELPPLPDDLAEHQHLGDLALAYPYTQAQAQQNHYALDDMFVLLVVHGTLHLLGYDHDMPTHRAEMWEAQGRALDTLGVSREIVPALEGTG